MGTTRHTLEVRSRARGTVKQDLRGIGDAGKKAGSSIAGGFIKAQLALGALKVAVRGTFRLFKSVTTDAIKAIDELGKRSQKIGVSVEFFSEMTHVAKLSGTSMETLARGIRNVSRNLRQATISAQMKDAFADLGINAARVAELMEGPVEDAFEAIVEGLGNLDTEAERVSLSMKTLGMLAGPELLPMVRQGIKGIREMREEARLLGLSVSEADFVLAAAAADAITRFQGAMDGLKRTLAIEFMPAITRALNTVAAFVAKNREKVVSSVKAVVSTVARFLWDAFKTLAVSVARLADILTAVTNVSVKRGAERLGARIAHARGKITKEQLDAHLRKHSAGAKANAEVRVRAAFAEIEGAMAEFLKVAKGAGEDAGNAFSDGFQAGLGGDEPGMAAAAGLEDFRRALLREFDLLDAKAGKERELRALRWEMNDLLAKASELAQGDLFTTLELASLIAEINELRKEEIELRHKAAAIPQGPGVRTLGGEDSEGQFRTTFSMGERFTKGMRTGADRLSKQASPEMLGESAIGGLASSFESLFSTIADGSKTAGEAFEAFGRSILAMVARLAAKKLVAELLGSFLGGGGDGGGGGGGGGVSLQHGGVALGKRDVTVGDVPEAIIPLSELPMMVGKLAGRMGPGASGETYQTNINVTAGPGSDGQAIAAVVATKVDEALRAHRGFRRTLWQSGGLHR